MSYKKIGIFFVCFTIICAIIYGTHITEYIDLSHIYILAQKFHALENHHAVETVFIYLILYITCITCMVPSVAPLTMMGGYLFGTVLGTFYALLASTLGSLCAFLILRYFLYDSIQERYGHRLGRFNSYLKKYGVAYYLITLQFLTIIPFVVINSLAVLANVPLVTVIWTTIVGSFPVVLLYAIAGKQLGSITSAHDMFSPSIIITFILLIILALLPIIVRKIRGTTLDM